MNSTFSLHTDAPTSSQGTSICTRTNESDMTAEHAFGCLCDERKHSVDVSGCLDDAKQIDS